MTRLDIDPRFAAAHYQDGRDLHGAQQPFVHQTSGDLLPQQPSVHSGAGVGLPLNAVRTNGEVALPDPQLCKFYAVSTWPELVAAMEHHIAKLQAKLPATPSLAPQRVREG